MKSFLLITFWVIILLKTTITIDAQSIEKKALKDYLKLPPSEENIKLKNAITEILKENIEIEDINTQQVGTPTDIVVYDNRIELHQVIFN